MSAQGLKRLQQMAFLFAMETGLCFYGYSGNRSLTVVSPFQLLELLNPLVETKGGRYADTSSERKPPGPRGADPRLRTTRCLSAPRFYQGGSLPHSCLWKLPPNVRVCHQMAAACPPLLLLPQETCLPLTPQVLWAHTPHFSVNGGWWWEGRGLRMQQFRISGHNGVSF